MTLLEHLELGKRAAKLLDWPEDEIDDLRSHLSVLEFHWRPEALAALESKMKELVDGE